jgi:hypothetical protein
MHDNALSLAVAMLSAVLFLPALSATQSNQESSAAAASDQTTIEGCLQGAGWEYTLTEKDGMTHQLARGKKLNQYVGHEVQITGVAIVRTTSTTPVGGAASVNMRTVFSVKSVKDLRKTCDATKN